MSARIALPRCDSSFLRLRRQLGTGEARRGIEKIRVVAEAAAAARRIDDRPVPAPVGEDWLGIGRMAHQHQHAVVMGATIGHACELGDELRVVARIGLRIAGVARRLHAGRAAQRRHTDA